MIRILIGLLFALMSGAAQAQSLLLDEKFATEIVGASDNTVIVDGLPVPAEFPFEFVDFQTCVPDQLVGINVVIPFTVHGLPGNGALRLYLDVIENPIETLLFNGGQWQVDQRFMNGRVSGVHYIHIPTPGWHTILIRGITSTPLTIITLRTMRHYQVLDVTGSCLP